MEQIDHVRTDGGVAESCRAIGGEAVTRCDGDEDPVGFELREFVFERGPLGNRVGVPIGTDREIDGGERRGARRSPDRR